MEFVKRQNLSEMVAEGIKNLIVEQALKPGDRLPTEQEMADRFGVSRVSVREATKALSFLGIIRAAPRRGLTVGEVDMRRVTEYLGFHLALTNYPNAQLLETRIVIESGGLPHIVKAMAEDATLHERLSEMTAALGQTRSAQRRIDGDIAFHRELLQASGLGPLVAFNDLLQIFFNRFRQSLLDAEWDKGVRQHQRLIDSLRDGDLETAQQTLSDHLNYHKSRL
ncbi:MAG: FadR family transcriptional regulator [Planctomycetia bacterium]|nr:FadR family transcriptional regulator [Planctomycetia bacterium]